MATGKEKARAYRRLRIRKKIKGISERPRLAIHRTLKHLQAQLIDDFLGKTLFGLGGGSGNVKGAKEFGRLFAKKALEKKITKVVFDRGGFLYHGRVKAFAEGAREGGLSF